MLSLVHSLNLYINFTGCNVQLIDIVFYGAYARLTLTDYHVKFNTEFELVH